MARVAMPFPVLPGKTETEVRAIAEMLRSRPAEYAESRRRGGVTLERAYLQQTPMGMFVVAYLETDGPIGEALSAPARSDLAIDRDFVAAVREVHGVDLSEAPPGPDPEVLGEWIDPDVTERGRGMAFSAPMIPGTEEHARAWTKETFASPGMTASRRALGQNVELVTMVHTPQGPVAAVYLEGVDPFDANRRFSGSTEPFDVAFKQELTRLFPPFIDFGKPVPGITEIFDSRAVLAAT